MVSLGPLSSFKRAPLATMFKESKSPLVSCPQLWAQNPLLGQFAHKANVDQLFPKPYSLGCGSISQATKINACHLIYKCTLHLYCGCKPYRLFPLSLETLSLEFQSYSLIFPYISSQDELHEFFLQFSHICGSFFPQLTLLWTLTLFQILQLYFFLVNQN